MDLPDNMLSALVAMALQIALIIIFGRICKP